MAARSHGVDFRNCVRSNFLQRITQTLWCRTRRINWAFQKMNTVFSALRTEGVHGFAETNTGFFPISELHEGLLQKSHGSRSGQSSVEWRRGPFLTAHPGRLLHASGWTLVTHGTACIPPARITLVLPPLPTLRIKHKCTCLFGIILKYYSQA
jgi:hypothetical protein